MSNVFLFNFSFAQLVVIVVMLCTLYIQLSKLHEFLTSHVVPVAIFVCLSVKVMGESD